MEECGKVLEILDMYEGASGQKVNRSKTALFFSKHTLIKIKHDIKVALGVLEIMQYERYLGLPSFVGKGKKLVLAISRRGYEGNSKDGKVNYYLKLVEKCYLNLSFKPFPRIPQDVLKFQLVCAMRLRA